MTPTPLGFAEVWRATLDAVNTARSLYFTLGAAFVVLPAMAVHVFGPPDPRSVADITPTLLGFQAAAALIGGVVQVAIAQLALGGTDAGSALRRGVTALPSLVVAALLTALALLPALMLSQASRGTPALLLPGLGLMIPGLYVVARLSLALPLLASQTLDPLAALRASWAATSGNAWRILALLAALIGLLLGLVLLAGGVAAALASVLTLLGGKSLGGFVVALVASGVAAIYTVCNAVMLAQLSRILGR